MLNDLVVSRSVGIIVLDWLVVVSIVSVGMLTLILSACMLIACIQDLLHRIKGF
jgi:hypothetical protein